MELFSTWEIRVLEMPLMEGTRWHAQETSAHEAEKCSVQHIL